MLRVDRLDLLLQYRELGQWRTDCQAERTSRVGSGGTVLEKGTMSAAEREILSATHIFSGSGCGTDTIVARVMVDAVPESGPKVGMKSLETKHGYRPKSAHERTVFVSRMSVPCNLVKR